MIIVIKYLRKFYGEIEMVKKIDFHIHTLSDSAKDNVFIYSSNWLKNMYQKSILMQLPLQIIIYLILTSSKNA